MKQRTLVALAVLVALAGIYFARSSPPASVGIRRLSLEEISGFDITNVELRGKDAFVLARNDGKPWTVTQSDGGVFPADLALVVQLYTALGPMKDMELVSERAERHSVFGIDDAGVRVVARIDGGVVRDIRVGYVDGKTYVNPSDAPDVYVGPPILGWLSQEPASTYRDHRIPTLPRTELSRLTVEAPNTKPISLTKSKVTKATDDKAKGNDATEEWTAGPGPTVSKAAADKLVMTLTDLRAAEFLEADLPLPAPETVFRLERASGAPVIVAVGRQDKDGKCAVRVEGSPLRYGLPAETAKVLHQSSAETKLFPPPAPAKASAKQTPAAKPATPAAKPATPAIQPPPSPKAAPKPPEKQ